MICVVWQNWGKDVLKVVHFSPVVVFLSPFLSITDFPIIPQPRRGISRDKREKTVSSSTEWCQKLTMIPTFNDYAMTIIWIQEFIDFPMWKKTISPATMFFITQIQNNLCFLVLEGYSDQTLSSCLFQIHRAQFRDRGGPEPLESLLHLSVRKKYHPHRQKEIESFQALPRQNK